MFCGRPGRLSTSTVSRSRAQSRSGAVGRSGFSDQLKTHGMHAVRADRSALLGQLAASRLALKHLLARDHPLNDGERHMVQVLADGLSHVWAAFGASMMTATGGRWCCRDAPSRPTTSTNRVKSERTTPDLRQPI
jgi:hypothetical protein